MRRRLLNALLSTCLALAICTPADAQPRRAQTAASRRADERTETNLRYQYDEMEQRIVRSGVRNTDPALNEFVQRIGCAVTADRCQEMRFYVIESSEFNASMAPNGMMLINSGLLLRAESEAELAFVMAHEFGHYANNDMIERMHAIRNANASGTMLVFVLGLTGVGALASLGYLPAIAGAMAFSRDQEHAADVFAADFANSSGYDSHAGVRAWENLQAEVTASSNETTRRRITQRSLFATHPLTADRIAYLSAIPNEHPDAGTDKTAYRNIIRAQLGRWLQAEIADRDSGATLALLDRLDAQGTDAGVLKFARGEVYRYRAEKGDSELALAAYDEAAQQPDAPLETWRQIGVIQRRLHNDAAAADAYRHYLELAPNAPDRQLITDLITTLGGTQP